ncbi:MAG: hypothetical protein H6831_03490 [Planctomycetes bacterium]|nr:hypothetical protein [Planctomycetota bacterium]MCB9903449.1 hypothetical protein [Planctomycetota bacterium]
MSIQAALVALALAAPQESGTDSADVWSQAELERVTEEIRLDLEELRGDTFRRPVTVRVTDGAGFLEHAKERVEAFTTEEQWAADGLEAKLLGLIPADMDLLATTYELLESQVGGFYDPGADTFYLMESYTGGLARVILSHELVHALDDQLFDLDAGMRGRVNSADALFAYQALCEGSAQLVSTRWVLRNAGTLSPADLEKASLGTEQLAGAPAYLWKPLLGAYLAGNDFLDKGYRIRRRELRKEASQGRTIAEAFENPPRSSEQILHPEKYWSKDARDEPQRVTHGVAPEGWTERGRTTLGELTLAILVDDAAALAGPDLTNPRSLLSLRYTNAAAEGWGGDEVVLLTKDDAKVLQLSTVWDTEADAQEFHDALAFAELRIRAVVDALGDPAGTNLRLDLPARRVTFTSFAGINAEDAAAMLAQLDVTVELPTPAESEQPEPAGAK